MKKTFKEYLKPAGYTEGQYCLVQYNGTLYRLDRIFELSIDLPVSNVKISAINFVESSKPEDDKVNAADLNVPIIVTPTAGTSGYSVIDGHNRLIKATRAGHSEILARVVFHDVLAMARFGSGPSVAFASNVGDQNPYVTESTSEKLIINLVSEKVSGDKGLLLNLKAADVDQIDLDDLEEDDEGNAGGSLEINLKNGNLIKISGEHLPPEILEFNTQSEKEQQLTIAELIDTVKRNISGF